MHHPRPGRHGSSLAAAVLFITTLPTPASTTPLPAHYLRLQLSVPSEGTPGFSVIPASPSSGIAFTNHVHPTAVLNNQILENVAGVALGDVDGDGRCDVYLCGSEPANALFRNLGNWRFEDITASSGTACHGQFSTGAAFADVDGDGDLDLLVNGLGVGTRLFRNDGSGRFTEDLQSGLVRRHGATSLALADADGDGDLDLYVATYRVISARSESPPPRVEIRRSGNTLEAIPTNRFLAFPLADGNAEIAEKGEPDHFYLNDGQGRFTRVSWTGGTFLDESGRPLTAPPEDWSLSVLFRDLTGDGRPDLYVCNDFFRSRDQFWIQDADRRFRAAPVEAWTVMSLSSMAADAADIDRDGHDDLFVVEMLARDHAARHRQRANAFRPEQALPFHDPGYRPELPRNTLFRSWGDGRFAEIAQFAGLAATDWSWNTAFLDVDLDGYEDLLIATGNAHDVLDLDAQEALDRAARRGPVQPLRFYPPLPQRLLAFRNQGDLTFSNTTASWRLPEPGIAHGLALADLDNDGDLDVVVHRWQAPVLLLRNDATAPRIHIRLVGTPPNTRAIGARIRVFAGPVPQSQVVVAGGRYLSADDTARTFAFPPSTTGGRIEIDWPDGAISVVTNVTANSAYQLHQPHPAFLRSPRAHPPASPALFNPVDTPGGHHHRNPAPPDFSRQPLLPRALNHEGPGVAWADINKDGWMDLVVPGGPGASLAFLTNQSGRAFHPTHPATHPAAGHHLALALWEGASNSPALLATHIPPPAQPHEPPPDASLEVWSLNPPALIARHPLGSLIPGPIAVADVDMDGDLDVFVGGRFIPGRFPAPAPSRLFLNHAGRLSPVHSPTPTHDTHNGPDSPAPWSRAGLVTGALFTDLDLDGDPDLVLACEWGPIRVFHNHRGAFLEATEQLGLASETGWWSGIASGDFDEDGRPDLIAANLGLNTRHRIPGPATWRLHAADLDQDGALEILEAYRPAGSAEFLPLRTRDVLARAVPAWQTRFPTYRAFAAATIPQLLQDFPPEPIPITVEVRHAAHRLLLNRGDHFESRPLPAAAQFSTASGIAVADFDGDGHLDAFLAQNSLDLDLDSGRADAGPGTVLLGDGRGGFRALSPAQSGFAIPGAQRGAAVADFDRDGRPDLCVTRHNGPTVLLRNTAGKPGIALHFHGTAGNRLAVGTAWRRVVDGQPVGPRHEIQSGSGHLSADAPARFLPRPDGPSELEVRWPDGQTTRHPVPTNVSMALRHPRG